MLHRPVYVISDSKMRQLEIQEHQAELDSILDQRKRLDESYNRQSECLKERECVINNEIKALSPQNSECFKDSDKKAVQGEKEIIKKTVKKFPNL